MHTIIKLTTYGYKYKMEVIKLNVECVDTYRKQPQVRYQLLIYNTFTISISLPPYRFVCIKKFICVFVLAELCSYTQSRWSIENCSSTFWQCDSMVTFWTAYPAALTLTLIITLSAGNIYIFSPPYIIIAIHIMIYINSCAETNI